MSPSRVDYSNTTLNHPSTATIRVTMTNQEQEVIASGDALVRLPGDADPAR